MRIALISDPLTTNYSNPVNKTIRSTHKNVINNIASAIEFLGHTVECVEANNELERVITRIKPHIVFNRSNIEDKKTGRAFTPSLLDSLKIPYTGSNAEVCISAFNKNKTKQILQEAGIPTTKYCLITDLNKIKVPDFLSFPLFIKPVNGGCSQGIYEQNLVFSKESCMKIVSATIEQNRQPVLVEEFLPGREFTVGILGNDPAQALPILEYINDMPKSNKYTFRSFNTKMIAGKSEIKSCPAILTEIEEIKIRNLAIETYKTIGCRDYARIDIRCDKDGVPHVLEVNALPSLISNGSSLATMAEAAGVSFDNLISTILNFAFLRYDNDYEHEDDLNNIFSCSNLAPCNSGVL